MLQQDRFIPLVPKLALHLSCRHSLLGKTHEGHGQEPFPYW